MKITLTFKKILYIIIYLLYIIVRVHLSVSSSL